MAVMVITTGVSITIGMTTTTGIDRDNGRV
jgi:hypothetical protein